MGEGTGGLSPVGSRVRSCPVSNCAPLGTSAWNSRHSSLMGVSRMLVPCSMTNFFTAAKRVVEVTSGMRDQSIAARSRDRSRSVSIPSFALVLKYCASPKSAISFWILWSETLMPPRSARAATRKVGSPP